jgi:hypothetical protein
MKTYIPALVLLATAAIPAFAGFITVTPEPSTMLLVGGGLGAAILIARKRQSRKK